MTLDEGKEGMIVRIDEVADSPLKSRLMTMGLIPGTRVKILRSALFGDPIAVNLRSYNLALRRSDAASIKVSAAG
jgi:Fe2+ transport system protein FeoA